MGRRCLFPSRSVNGLRARVDEARSAKRNGFDFAFIRSQRRYVLLTLWLWRSRRRPHQCLRTRAWSDATRSTTRLRRGGWRPSTSGGCSGRRLLAHRRHQAAAPAVREGPRVRLDVPRRGAARGPHPPPQRRPTLDVVAIEGELLLVMDYVDGESFARLIARRADGASGIPPPSSLAIHRRRAAGAARRARGDRTSAASRSRIVHRDVSPPEHPRRHRRVRARARLRRRQGGGAPADDARGAAEGQARRTWRPSNDRRGLARHRYLRRRRGLWEMLTRRRLHHTDNEMQTFADVLSGRSSLRAPSLRRISPELDRVVMQALRTNPTERFFTAREMARALQHAAPMAPAPDVGDWVHAQASGPLTSRAKKSSRTWRVRASCRAPRAFLRCRITR